MEKENIFFMEGKKKSNPWRIGNKYIFSKYLVTHTLVMEMNEEATGFRKLRRQTEWKQSWGCRDSGREGLDTLFWLYPNQPSLVMRNKTVMSDSINIFQGLDMQYQNCSHGEIQYNVEKLPFLVNSHFNSY